MKIIAPIIEFIIAILLIIFGIDLLFPVDYWSILGIGMMLVGIMILIEG